MNRKLPTGRRDSLFVRNARSGAAVVELALCLPVIAALTFATIEA